MKKLIISIAKVTAVLIFTALLFMQNVNAQSSTIKIGVYDSRQVVLAYANSSAFKEWRKNIDQRTDSANKSGNKEMYRNLSVEAMSFQHLLHQMCFSTASISVLLKPLKDQFPALAKAAGVDLIVSKFDLDYSVSGIKTIDVTDRMVKLFNPKGDFEKTMKEIAKTEPMPLQEMSIEEDMLNLYCTRFGK